MGGQAGARISRPEERATPSCAPPSRRSPPASWTWASAPARPSLSTCRTRPIHPALVLRRAEGRRAHRAPLAARCRARAGLQAEGLRRAHPRHHQHRLHGAAGAEAQGRRPRRSPDRRRRHGLRPLGHPDHADRGRTPAVIRFDKLRDGRAPAKLPRQWPKVGRGGHRAAAVHRRHHRQAQGRHAQPRQPQRRLLDLQALERSAAHLRARRGQGHLRAAAVPHLRADHGAAARPAGGQRAAAARALRRGDHARRHRGQEGDRVPGRADHVDRARQHARHRQARLLLAALCRLRRRGAAGRGGRALPEADRPAPRRRLGHDRDLARRHGDAARMDGQGRLGRPAAAGHRHGHRRARRSAPRAARPARRARSASRAPTSPRATGTRPRRRRPRSSTATC